jgi:drug/metabolite transporter (DMT)-like permease
MNWFLIALLPPALWSITNHFDKYLLSKYFKGGGVGALMIFSSIIGLILLPFIIFFHPEVLGTFNPKYLLISLNGFFYLLATLPYFYALQKDEASVAVPLFQMVPVFSFFLSYLVLRETLNPAQIVGGVIIIIGAILISLDLSTHKKIKFKKEVFFLMALSSLLFAINFLFFKYFAIDVNFWVTSFWEYIGFAVFALLLLIFIKPYRNQFLDAIKINSTSILSLNGINEVINIIAKASFNFASLLAPLTLVWIVNGFQPFFVFIYGIILTLLFPKISQENITRKVLFQKLLAILIMFAGAFFVNRS